MALKQNEFADLKRTVCVRRQFQGARSTRWSGMRAEMIADIWRQWGAQPQKRDVRPKRPPFRWNAQRSACRLNLAKEAKQPVQFPRKPCSNDPNWPTFRQTLHAINFKVKLLRTFALFERTKQFRKLSLGGLSKEL